MKDSIITKKIQFGTAGASARLPILKIYLRFASPSCLLASISYELYIPRMAKSRMMAKKRPSMCERHCRSRRKKIERYVIEEMYRVKT